MNGSSTTGVKKSTVLTIARSSRTRYTPASSPVEIPTSKLGSPLRSSRARTAERSSGPNLPAQPAALQRAVSRMSSLRLALLFSFSAIDDSKLCRRHVVLQRRPAEGSRSFCAELADVADASGHARMVEVVEQRDRE